MARTPTTRDDDVIARVAHAGEEALRRLFSLPRRIVAGTLDEAGDILHGVATKLGRADPMDSRVTALEKRLDSLEKPVGTTRSSAATRTRPAEPAQADGEGEDAR